MNRFWNKVDKSAGKDSCWLWNGTVSTKGYGRFYLNGRMQQAHRVSYQIAGGVIAAGLELDHLCRNRDCVNPDHLEPVSTAENLRRGNGFSGRNHRKTHCIRGHAFTPENTIMVTLGRRCRECGKQDDKNYHAKKRLARMNGGQS